VDKTESRLSSVIDNVKHPLESETYRLKCKETLDKEGVAKDIIGYPKAPPSLRLWGGATVQNNDMKALLPWIDWAYHSVKNNV